MHLMLDPNNPENRSPKNMGVSYEQYFKGTVEPRKRMGSGVAEGLDEGEGTGCAKV